MLPYKDKGYNEKIVRKQILKAGKFSRKDLLKINGWQYIILFAASGSVIKLFSVDYVSFLNTFFNRFCPVEKYRVIPHFLYRDSLTLRRFQN